MFKHSNVYTHTSPNHSVTTRKWNCLAGSSNTTSVFVDKCSTCSIRNKFIIIICGVSVTSWWRSSFSISRTSITPLKTWAFDSRARAHVMQIFNIKGLVQVIEALYKSSTSKELLDKQTGACFHMTVGVHQGCPL